MLILLCCPTLISVNYYWKKHDYWKMSVFVTIPKKDNATEWSKYHTIALTSLASKVILKILQAELQQCVDWEPPDVQAEIRKSRGTWDKIPNIPLAHRKNKRISENNICCCLIDYTKAFDYVDHDKLWENFKEMGAPDNFVCLVCRWWLQPWN